MPCSNFIRIEELREQFGLVITSGSNWKFLRLEHQTVSIDYDEYLISQIGKILGILIESLNAIGHATVGGPIR